MFFICPIFSQIDENYPVETEFLRVFANDSDVGLVTIQFVNMTMMSNKSSLTKMGW